MDMSDDSTTSYEQYAFVFLYIIAGASVCVGLCSWAFSLSTYLRLRASKNGRNTPTRTNFVYTAVSILREISYLQLRISGIGNLPNTGILLGFAGYSTILLGCLLSNIWAPIPMFWEAIAMRAAYLSVAQLPLLIVLSTKKNMIAYLFNTSHERLIVYHQFLGICLLMTTSLHMGYFVKEWLYYDVWKSQWAQMGVSMLQWGFAAWGLLLLTVVTSISLFRSRLYDGWVILHLATMLAFFAMLILHLDPPYRVWAYVPLGFWTLDRAWRFSSRMRLNSSLGKRSICRASATIEPLQGDVARVTIHDFRLRRLPGQYIYLSLYKLGVHSHPFTIVSACTDKDVVLLIKAKQGFTRRLVQAGSMDLPPTKLKLKCSIEGPYGGTQTRFQSFHSAIFISGGTGGTFSINLLKDLVTNPGCCRSISYIWAIRAECHITWFAAMFEECRMLALQNGIDLHVEIWITKDTTITTEESKSAGSACRSSKCRCQASPEARPSLSSDPSISSTGSINHALIRKPQCCCSRGATDEKSPSWVLHAGRPDLSRSITQVVQVADGETGIAVCGPQGLTTEVRNTVVRISDERATKKGSGCEAIYLHVENQF